MAYQNVSTPRIFINIPEFMASTGEDIDSLFRTVPVKPTPLQSIDIPHTTAITYQNPFVALLGHTLTTETVTFNDSPTSLFNGTNGSFKKGFSIFKFSTDVVPKSIQLEPQSSIYSIVSGIYYDFKSPDLDLSLEYQYDGLKETTTKGGGTLINKFYSKPPNWGSLGAWELGGGSSYSKSGRRVWSLSFSYLSDSDIFPTSAALTNNDENDTTTNTLLEENTLQRCIHLTGGGQNPFLFCSDSSNIRQDNLAIARFDMSSFKFKQVAFGTYNIKIKIREVW